MRSTPEMTPTPDHTAAVPTGHESSFMWLLKIAFTWFMTAIASVTKEDVATYLSIILTTLLIVNHLRKEWFIRRERDSQFQPTQPESRP